MITRNDVVNLIVSGKEKNEDTIDEYIEYIRPVLEEYGVYKFWESCVDKLIVDCVKKSVSRKMIQFNSQFGTFYNLFDSSTFPEWDLLLEEIRDMREYEEVRCNEYGNRIPPWYEKHITLAFHKFVKQYESAGFTITKAPCGCLEISLYSVCAEIKSVLNGV